MSSLERVFVFLVLYCIPLVHLDRGVKNFEKSS